MVRRPSRRAYIGQWVFLLAVIVVGGLLIHTLGANLARLHIPNPVMRDGATLLPWLAVILLVATPFVWRLPLKDRRVGPWALVLPVAAIGLLAAAIQRLEVPALTGFNITGGVQVPPELVA